MSRTLQSLQLAKTDARPLGVTRILLGASAVLETFELADGLNRLGQPGFFRFPVAAALSWLPGSMLAMVLIALWGLAALAFLLGWRTRVAGSLLVAMAVIVLLTDQQLYSNHLYLLGLFIGLATLADAGAGLSLDARPHGQRTVSTWPVALLMLQLSIVYGFSALAKLNPSYLSGSVMASYLRTDGPLSIPEAWRTFQPMLVLSIVAVLAEGLLAIGLWLPHWRRNAFVVGLGLHLSIVLTFQPPLQFAVFALATLAPYVLFLQAAPGSRLVIWDPSCGFCRGWVRWFQRLDWLGALRFAGSDDARLLSHLGISRESADQAIHLVGPDGTTRGFAAVRHVAEVLPLSFLWAPLLGLPPIQAVGERIYRAVARRRRCHIPPIHPVERDGVSPRPAGPSA